VDEPIWISRAILEAMHSDQIRAHGGQPGLRDQGLLESALARPQNAWAYQPDVDLAALAAEYAFGLIKNHAFLDGNKRIGFVVANVFLILNGQEIDVPETEAVKTVLRVAEGTLDRDGLAAWIRRSLKGYAG
jgi:death-on-curing protein